MSIFDGRAAAAWQAVVPERLRRRLRMPLIKVVYAVKAGYSANGEDLWLREVTRSQPVWYFEIGAGDPKYHSNTFDAYRRGAHGVVIDANPRLLARFAEVRPRDTAVWGAVQSGDSEAVTFFELDPWEVSTCNSAWLESATAGTARLVQEHVVPRVDVSALLEEHVPTQGAVTVLNIDIEGDSLTALGQIDLNRFRFDIVLIEIDVPEMPVADAGAIHAIDGYTLAAVLGPTLAYRREASAGTYDG